MFCVSKYMFQLQHFHMEIECVCVKCAKVNIYITFISLLPLYTYLFKLVRGYPTAGLTLFWAWNPFTGNFNHWQVSRKEAGHGRPLKRLLGYVSLEWVNKWPNSMTDT